MTNRPPRPKLPPLRTSTYDQRPTQQPPIPTRETLRDKTRWIRDILDPQIARDGPSALRPADMIELDELLRQLPLVDREDVRVSRMYLAVLEIAGRATRWPAGVIGRCEGLLEGWGDLGGGGGDGGGGEKGGGGGGGLYEPGGRLWGVCRPEDVRKGDLVGRWIRERSVKALASLRTGDLGFRAGDWWINPLFAFRDGIIDRSEAGGGIVADAHAAYAVLMAGDEEVESPEPYSFVYRAKVDDPGRYRLTSATPESRKPIRVLRSHTLRSFWTPKAGVRYDGLHKVVSWSIHFDKKARRTVYDITFRRLASEPSMDRVLCRPWTDEVEDYKEYKRLRQQARAAQHKTQKQAHLEVKEEPTMTARDANVDGPAELAPGLTTRRVAGMPSTTDVDGACEGGWESSQASTPADEMAECASFAEDMSPVMPLYAPLVERRLSLLGKQSYGRSWHC